MCTIKIVSHPATGYFVLNNNQSTDDVISLSPCSSHITAGGKNINGIPGGKKRKEERKEIPTNDESIRCGRVGDVLPESSRKETKTNKRTIC